MNAAIDRQMQQFSRQLQTIIANQDELLQLMKEHRATPVANKFRK